MGRGIYNVLMNVLSVLLCVVRSRCLRWTMRKDSKIWKFVVGQKGIIQHVATTMNQSDDQRPVCWVHVASLGEYGAGRPVVKALQQNGFRVVLTVFSSTAYDVLSHRADAADHVFYLPLDTRCNASRFLDVVKPQRAVFIISEYWINYLTELGCRETPTFFTSMLVPQTTYLKKWYAAPIRKALKDSVTMFMVLNKESEQQLRDMGFSQITIVGDPLFDNAILVAQTPYSNAVVESFCKTATTIFMAGSISDDNDLEIVASVANRHADVKFIMVPHEIDDQSLAHISERCQGQSLRYSQCQPDTDFTQVQILIIDYVGDLVRLYRYAHYSYVGGGFTNLLHSVIEPVVYGIPVSFGPNIHRKATPRQMIDRGFAAVVHTGEELENWLQSMWSVGYDNVRSKALAYINENGGSTQTICELIQNNKTQTSKPTDNPGKLRKVTVWTLRCLRKIMAALVLVVVLAVLLTAFSPIYDFRAPTPFQGPDIFNPYKNLDTVRIDMTSSSPENRWKRTLFHTHTRVEGPFPWNECKYSPKETWEALQKLGYDIVTFSNHNELTKHPFDPRLQVNVYEHGFNPFKFHKLVFGSKKVIYYDPLLPLLASQKQFELDYLGARSDFIQINHPYRTIGTCKKHMEELSGYELMELDTGKSTENEYWDWALSAGHYSFGLANDDLHNPDRTSKIGVRCNFLWTSSGRYEDLKNTLLAGCFYAMRVPDYGHGDWDVKYAKNRTLPSITAIGLRTDTIFLKLSAVADSIRVTGQDHRTLALIQNSDTLSYVFRKEDHYARLTAFFPDGEVIYTNPFARYNAALSDSPFNNAPQHINWLLTVLYNLLVICLLCLTIRKFYLLLFKRCKRFGK